MFSLCLIAGVLLACPADRGSGTQVEAVYDLQQKGSLPRMRFERPVEAVNAMFGGEPVEGDARTSARGEPRWDLPRAFPIMEPWQELPLTPGVVFCSGTGVDRDGVTPLAAAFDQHNRRLVIWRGQSPFASEAIPMLRGDSGETSIDALGGTPAQRTDLSYTPRSILILHGTIVLECQRNRLDLAAGVDWVAEGISLVRVDRVEGKGWRQALLADLPAPIDGGLSRGQPRGYVSTMANHYPSRRDGRFLETWIPFVDYQHQVGEGAHGGQLFLMRAFRPHERAAWQFEGPTLLYEEIGPPGRHFHCAGWTPNGIVLSIGDSELSEVKVLRCSDWKHFQDKSRWSIEDNFHGLAGPSGVLGSANQFWGCAPGRHLNELLVGGDNISSAICRLEVPAEQGKRAAFKHVWGLPPGDLGDQGNTALTCNVIVRPTPERDGRAFARTNYEGAAGGASLSRLVWSNNGEDFDVVSRLPWNAGKQAFCTVLGSWLIAPAFLSSQPVAWHAQRFDPEVARTRALRVEPPGTNAAANPAGPLANVLAGAGASVTPFLPSDSRYHQFAATLPWNGPMWHVRAPQGHAATLLTSSVRTEPWGPSVLSVPIAVANLRSESLRVRAQLSNVSSSWGTTFSIVTRDEWFPCSITTPAYWGSEGGVNQLSFVQVPVQPEGEVEFLLSVGGAYAGVAAGIALDSPSDTDLAGEAWTQPLPMGTRAVTAELWCPEWGADSSIADGLGAPAILSVVSTSGDAVELRVGHSSRLHAWHWRKGRDGNDELVTAQVLQEVFMVKGDPLRLTIELHPSGTRIDGVAGGSTRSSGEDRWLAESLRGTLGRVVAGDRFGRVSLPIAVHRVVADSAPREMAAPSFEERTCPFDLDGDGDQDDADAFLVLYFGGPCESPESCPWDVDGSGYVDVLDAIQLAQIFAADPCP